jgi:IS5 family transposase
MAAHPRAAERLEMSRVLDAAKLPFDAIRHDLAGRRKVSVKKGREGMSAEQVMRAGFLKQMFDVSYDELAFHLGDSLQLRAFCRLSPSASAPKRSALQANIGAIRPKTWEAINQALVLEARQQKVEDGGWMRTDTTVVESNIHHPLDSSLLWDGVRVLTRILRRANESFGTSWCNHARRAKRRSVAILHAGTMPRRLPLYKDLLKVANHTLRCAEKAKTELESMGGFGPLDRAASLSHFLPLVRKVIEQTERRVLRNEQVIGTLVPAGMAKSAPRARPSAMPRTLAPPSTARQKFGQILVIAVAGNDDRSGTVGDTRTPRSSGEAFPAGRGATRAD